ncbi:hypothetical protein [Chryseobacterium wanjuense]
MIKNNIIGLCLLAGLSVLSCKKDQHKNQKNVKDSAVVSQTVDDSAKSVQKTNPVEKDSANENQTGKKNSAEPGLKNAIEGKYVAKTCDGGRFSIEIKNINDKPSFKILDKTKVVASGNASVEGDESSEGVAISMGEIGGLYEGDKITIQNSGNSMNEFEHFTQCGDKYLEFTKQK